MSMTMHINVGGTWKEITQPSINVSGTWKKVTDAWVNVGGTWKKFYTSIRATLPSNIASITSWPTSTARVELLSNGTWAAVNGDSGTWLTSGTNSDFECRASSLSGTTPSGTLNTWLALSSTRSWSLTTTEYGGTKSCSFTLEIRLAAAPNTIMATSSVYIEAGDNS